MIKIKETKNSSRTKHNLLLGLFYMENLIVANYSKNIEILS